MTKSLRKYYYTTDHHCSCAGLNFWGPEEVSIDEIKRYKLDQYLIKDV